MGIFLSDVQLATVGPTAKRHRSANFFRRAILVLVVYMGIIVAMRNVCFSSTIIKFSIENVLKSYCQNTALTESFFVLKVVVASF